MKKNIVVIFLFFSLGSCKKKDTNCYAEITVIKQPNNTAVAGAKVCFHEGIIFHETFADNSGLAAATFKLEAILKVSVSSGGDSSKSNIKLIPGETVKKTITL